MAASSGRFAGEDVPSNIEKAIRDFLGPHTSSLGIEDIRIEPGEDHDGDPVVFVQVKHRLLRQPINVKNVIALDRQLRDRVWNEGERRFIHVRHHYDERQGVAA